MTRTSLHRDVFWSVLGQVVSTLLGLVLTISVARLDKSGGLMGDLSVALAANVPLAVFFNMQLRIVAVSDANSEFSFSEYLGFRLICVGLFGLGVALVATLWSSPTAALAVGAVAAVRAVDLVADILFGYLQRHQRLRAMAVSVMVRGAITTFAMLWVLRTTHSVPQAAVFAAGLLALEITLVGGRFVISTRNSIRSEQLPGWQAWTSLRPAFGFDRMIRLTKRALPMGLAALLGAALTQLPIYLVNAYQGRESVGRFSVIYNPMFTLQVLVVGALEGVLSRLSAAYAAGDRAEFLYLMRRLLALAILFAVALVAGVLLIGRWTLANVLGPTYAQESVTFSWLAVAGGLGFIALALSGSLTAARRFNTLFILSVIGAPISTAICFLLTRPFGGQGAAWAVALSHALSIAVYGGILLHLVNGMKRKEFSSPGLTPP